MASETVSSKCATNDEQNFDSLDCADSHDNDSLNRDHAKVTKSCSPIVRKQISSAKCRCSSASKETHVDRRSLYRTYSSYGFKNLKKDQSHSHWSLVEGTSKNWNDDKCEKGDGSCCRKKYELADFHRCLKLLGLNTNNQTDLEPQHRQVPNTKKAKPKIVTRLTGSTVSLNDIQDAVLNDFERNHVFDPRNRSFLAQAVYERWYFNKLQEQKRQQRENELKNELMRMEFERIRCEQKLKAEKSYKDWMQKKKTHSSSPPKTDALDKNKRNSERKFLPKNPEKEYTKWKTAKNEELSKKRQQRKEQKQREAEADLRKKIEAEKAYQAWQNKITEELKKKIIEEKKRMKEKKEEENRNKEEKEKEAVTCFKAWKQNKLQQLKNIQDKQKFESKLKVEARTQRIAERLYEAEQAFYEWLNSVDRRINSAKS